MGIWRGLDGVVRGIVAAGQWLVLPLMVLLFLQWPLRDLVRAYSRDANDLGQVMFALYVAISVTAATRAGTHLAADLLARNYSVRTRRWLSLAGAVLGLAPWALFILIAYWSTVLQSVLGLERFPDTSNAGYFLVKFALALMAFLILAQVALDIVRFRGKDER